MCTRREGMYIDRAHQITLAAEAAGATRPISAFGLLTMPGPQHGPRLEVPRSEPVEHEMRACFALWVR